MCKVKKVEGLVMLQITRLAANFTKTSRKTLKNVVNGKINLENASDSFNTFYNNKVKDLKYSKNIFKRAVAWIKDFVKEYKGLKSDFKAGVKASKILLGKDFTRKIKKEMKTTYVDLANYQLGKVKTELGELIKAAKIAKK